MTLVPSRIACQKLGIHPNTLRKWESEGKIRAIRSPGGRRMYDLSSFDKGTKKIIYARVSSNGQKEDLKHQIEYLRARYPDHELIQDIGSGLNFKRKGFKTLLEQIMSGNVAEVVVVHRDRLCRFGFEMLQSIADKFNTQLVVLCEITMSPQEELVRDLISIIHVFSCRIYGLRKYSNKIKEDKDIPKEQEPSEQVSGTQ